MPIRLNVPNINTGKAWSDMDDRDLKASFTKGMAVQHKDVIAAAEFLCRNGEEVRARLRELGYIRSRRDAARAGSRKRSG